MTMTTMTAEQWDKDKEKKNIAWVHDFWFTAHLFWVSFFSSPEIIPVENRKLTDFKKEEMMQLAKIISQKFKWQ